jgi:predicted permease
MMMQPHFMPASGMLLDNRGWGGIYTVGRLADDVSIERAREDLAGIGAWLRETYPRLTDGREYTLEPLPQATLTPSDRAAAVQFSGLLAAVIGVVLMVACVNVANLMLSRALQRRREIAVRQALGADRGRLLRQLLAESLTLSSIGGVAGIAIAYQARGVLQRLPFPFALDFGFDARILGFVVVVTLFTGVAFGVVPALAATRVDLTAPMRRSSPRARGRRFTLFGGLVVAQVALSLTLLIAAGLFVRTLVALGSSELGFDAEEIAVAAVDPSLQGYEGDAVREYYRRLVERVAGLPGVESVSFSSALPAGGDDSLSFTVEGMDAPPDGLYANVTVVGPRFFETLGIPMVRGRELTEADNAAGEPVLVVNESGARELSRLVPGDPMDVRLSFDGAAGPFARIVGIAADSKNSSLRDEPQPMAYLPAAQRSGGWYAMALLARTETIPAQGLVPALRAALREVDRNVPAFRVGTLEEHLAETLLQERLAAGLVGFAAILALALASVGLYGILSYSVARRTREMGIRMALGARAARVRYLVMRQALTLVMAGAVIGVVASLGAASLLSSFLWGVTATDPLTYVTVVGLLLLVALAASYVPARRATRADPRAALRAE